MAKPFITLGENKMPILAAPSVPNTKDSQSSAPIILTKDQIEAEKQIVEFVLNGDIGSRIVLSGYGGTGKTTLIKSCINKVYETIDLKNKILKAASANSRVVKTYEFALSATTNKAAEALSEATKMDAVTIHSLLGMTVRNNKLSSPTKIPKANIIIIDEASFLNEKTQRLIEGALSQKKIIYVGDPAQLAPINSKTTPVFDSGYQTVHLTEVVRQEPGNQIATVSESFRKSVNGEEFIPFIPDNKRILILEADEFAEEAIKEFNRADFNGNDAKVLAWTNAAVHEYNRVIKSAITGEQELRDGDYALNNTYFKPGRTKGVKTDGTVKIVSMFDNDLMSEMLVAKKSIQFKREPDSCLIPELFLDSKIVFKDVVFNYNSTEYHGYLFDQKNLKALKKANNILYKEEIPTLIDESKIVDLRPLYSCTVNKSQGSTYRKVFIDLNDIGNCKNSDQMTRMLYVAFSRASQQVILTGDIS